MEGRPCSTTKGNEFPRGIGVFDKALIGGRQRGVVTVLTVNWVQKKSNKRKKWLSWAWGERGWKKQQGDETIPEYEGNAGEALTE